MNIQPVSLFNEYKNNHVQIQKRASVPAFSGEQKRSQATDVFLKNAAKSLAIASAITFVPIINTSCEKEFTEEDCDHPNHIDPPYVNDTTEVKPDTVYLGTTYKTPAISMKRYKIENGDTIGIGNVTFSQGAVYVPNNAYEADELKTVLNFIDALGLNSSNLNEEYAATKAFDYNLIPAQITWLNEKTGTVNQLTYNGYNADTSVVKMNLTSIGIENPYVEKELVLTSAGSGRLLVDIYPNGSSTLETRYLYTLDGNTVSKFEMSDENTFKKSADFTSNGTGTSISAVDTNENEYKLANFNVFTAISKEE